MAITLKDNIMTQNIWQLLQHNYVSGVAKQALGPKVAGFVLVMVI